MMRLLQLIAILTASVAWAQRGTVVNVPGNTSTGLTFRGTWNSATAYNANDLVVSSTGVGYVARASNSNTALTTTATWQSLAPATQPYDLPFSMVGLPPANTIYPWVTYTRAVAYPANFTGAVGSLSANPTATATFIVSQVRSGATTQIGTVTISTGGVFTFASTSGAAITTQAGDRWTVTTPATQDSTLAGVSFSVTGSR